jgi:hypothetical protein
MDVFLTDKSKSATSGLHCLYTILNYSNKDIDI